MLNVATARPVLAQTLKGKWLPKSWGRIKTTYAQKLANLLLNALHEQRRPVMVHATVWLAEGKTISDLTDYLGKWVRANPVKNGQRWTSSGAVQKYRPRNRVLYTWVREQKDTNAVNCLHESGVHHHVCLVLDGHSFQKKSWPEFIMRELQAAGIVADHPKAWMVTGRHTLDTQAKLQDAYAHSLYLAKSSQDCGSGRNMGSSLNLLPLMQDDTCVVDFEEGQA